MFFHLLYIHLFRPFLKYSPTTSPLPSHVSPRKLCTSASSAISKLMRVYKRTYGLRQICNIAVYIVHSACTIHLLNLPDKAAKRDIVHGVKHLEEIGEDWLCARRTLSILSVLARKWKIEMPDEARDVLDRTDAKYGTFSTADVPSPKPDSLSHLSTAPSPQRQSISNLSSPQDPSPVRYNTPEANMLSNASSAVRNNSGGMPSNHLYSAMSSYMPITANSLHVNTQVPMTLGADNPVMDMTASYLRRTHTPNFNVPPSARRQPQTTVSQMRRQAMTSAPPVQSMTRQVSPSTMFGGVEALVQGQDWWLRDQANLVVGFDNWEELDGEGMGMGLASTMGGMAGGGAFYMDGNGSLDGSPGMGGQGQEDWYT